ncbi:MAG: hypothetical protein U1E39_00320 [Planctomycetota bacterium]
MSFDEVSEIVHRHQESPSGAIGGLGSASWSLADGERLTLVFDADYPGKAVGLQETTSTVSDEAPPSMRHPWLSRLMRAADFAPEHDRDP